MLSHDHLLSGNQDLDTDAIESWFGGISNNPFLMLFHLLKTPSFYSEIQESGWSWTWLCKDGRIMWIKQYFYDSRFESNDVEKPLSMLMYKAIKSWEILE